MGCVVDWDGSNACAGRDWTTSMDILVLLQELPPSLPVRLHACLYDAMQRPQMLSLFRYRSTAPLHTTASSCLCALARARALVCRCVRIMCGGCAASSGSGG